MGYVTGRGVHLLVAAMVLSAGVGTTRGQTSRSGDSGLFKTTDPGRVVREDERGAPTLWRAAEIDADRLDRREGVLELNLFDRARFLAIVEWTVTHGGLVVFSGKLDGLEPSTVRFTADGHLITGTVRTPLDIYRIRPLGDGLWHGITMLRPPTQPLLGEPIPVPACAIGVGRRGCEEPR